jgi:DNA-binding NarL/FixJ family response regulator
MVANRSLTRGPPAFGSRAERVERPPEYLLDRSRSHRLVSSLVSTGVIGPEVFLSEGTVGNHLSAAMGKLGAANRAEAVRIATENGWLG